MNKNFNKGKNTHIYEIGQMIGLNNNDINSILNTASSIKDRPYLSNGPIPYLGSLYGTINLKDIK